MGLELSMGPRLRASKIGYAMCVSFGPTRGSASEVGWVIFRWTLTKRSVVEIRRSRFLLRKPVG